MLLGAARPGRRAVGADLTRILLDARVTRGGPGVYARDLIAGLHSVGAPDVSLQVVGHGRPFVPWGRLRVAAMAQRWAADVVHGLHVEVPPFAARTVVTILDLIPLDHPASVSNPVRRLAYRRLVDTSLRRAARIIVPSPATEDRLVAHGVARGRVTVIPLGANRRFRPLDEEERELARGRFAGGRRYVVASSGPRAHKNLRGLVEAAALLRGDVMVILTGAAPAPGLEGVTFVGRLADKDVARLYGGADVVVLPAFAEGFGLPAVEALACGVPVVCGAGTGALPYIRAGAVEVDVRRPADLAAAINAVLDDDHLRSTLGAAGRQVAAELTVETMASRTLAVYREVLAQPSEATRR